MILSVCLNPARDVTYAVAELTVGASHPVAQVYARAGGKGVNVARVLHQMGEPVVVCGFCGGTTGEAIKADLDVAGLAVAFTAVSAPSRQTVTIGDGRQATVFREPGGPIGEREWQAFTARFIQLARSASVVVLSGSTPPGVRDDAYATLTAAARIAGARVVLDADGPHLRTALKHRPEVAKPNSDEVADLLGRPARGRSDAVAAGQLLLELGAGAAVVSRGRAGIIAVASQHAFEARLPEPVSGNPTGAGDALAAVIAAGLTHGHSWPRMLADAVALCGAAVAFPVAGGYAESVRGRLRPPAIVEEI